MIDTLNISFTVAVATVAILFYFTYSLLFKKTSCHDSNGKLENSGENDSHSKEQTVSNNKPKEKKSNLKLPNKVKEPQFKHRLLASILKAHSDTVNGIDFSSNGKYLLSAGSDRAIFLWSTKEFELQQHKSIRCNVEFDHAIKVRFSPDSKSFIAGLSVSNTIRAFKVNKNDSNVTITQAAVQDFPQKHKSDLISIGLSCNAKFLMTCSKDTTINIWNPKGEILGTIDTRLMSNAFAAVSPCGRFFGACGFTSEVKIWEVLFDKVGNFKEIKRAFELKGHSAGIYNFSFNSDSTRMVTVSKDNTWILWNTFIEYERGQDAKILLTGKLNTTGPSLIALSPDSYSVAVSVGDKIYFFDGLTAKCDEIIENACNDEINEICFSNDNKYLAVACDRQVKIFYNITGHKVAINDLSEKLKAAKTQASKERMEQNIEEHRQSIKNIELKVNQV